MYIFIAILLPINCVKHPDSFFPVILIILVRNNNILMVIYTQAKYKNIISLFILKVNARIVFYLTWTFLVQILSDIGIYKEGLSLIVITSSIWLAVYSY